MTGAPARSPGRPEVGVAPGRERAIGWRVAGRIGLVLLIALVLGGCAGGAGGRARAWGEAVPRDERDLALAGLPIEAQRSFLPLSAVFYDRITSRRFNSRATFDDPSVRQFFPTVAAYSDYYAALVDVLDRAHFRFNQPTRIELLGLSATGDGVLKLSLYFVGKNDLPLRWWNAKLLRTDEWRWQDGRWWVVPGKL